MPIFPTRGSSGAPEELVPSCNLHAGSEIERIWQAAYRGGFYRGGPVLMSALSGIDIALWDMKGGWPLCSYPYLLN